MEETGLLASVCRHGIPLRLLDIYSSGERYADVVKLIEATIEVGPKTIDNWIVTYDIGCRLSPYLQNRKPELLSKIKPTINAFHSYCHKAKCQVLYGPKGRSGMGETDGEGVERFWAYIKGFVPLGRLSTSTRRRQGLGLSASATAEQLRGNILRILARRAMRANKN